MKSVGMVRKCDLNQNSEYREVFVRKGKDNFWTPMLKITKYFNVD